MLGNLGQWVEQVIAGFGYPGLAALMLLENLFPPIPSEVVLPLAGFFVGRGYLGIVPAILAATIGSLVGAFVLYSLGR
jgi:membrane protein DedA with SNARE-associated domain